MNTRETIHEKLRLEIEAAAASVQRSNAIAAELATNTLAQGDLLRELTDKVLALRRLVGHEVPELAKLQARIDRILELKNMQELGSFQIQINRVMQAAWEKLP